MKTTRPGPWQYSLAALMGYVAIAAIVCWVAQLTSYPFVIGLGPLVWVFWATYSLVSKMIASGNRNSSVRGPEPPVSAP